MPYTRLLIVVLLVSSAAEARAQVFVAPPPPPLSMPDMIWNSHIMRQLGTNAAGQAVFGEQLKRDLEKKNQPAANGGTASGAPAAPTYSSALSYPFAGRHVLATMITDGQGRGAAALEADDVNAFVGALWSDYQRSFQEENQRLQMPYNDVASAMTYCIIMSYMIYNGIGQLAAERSVAVYRQTSRLFLENPEFTKLSATDRQAVAEVLVALGGMPGMTQRATRDAAQARKLAEQTLVNLFGKDGAKVRVTDRGVEF